MRVTSGWIRSRMKTITSGMRMRASPRRASSASSSSVIHGRSSTDSSTASEIFRPACTVRSRTSSIFQKYGARPPPPQQLQDLLGDARRRGLQDLVAMPQDGVVRGRIDVEAEARGKLDGPHHPHRILAEADVGVA